MNIDKHIEEVVESIFDTEYIGGKQPNLNKEYVTKALKTLHATILREVEEVLEQNVNETLWGDDNSNEVMKVSIQNYKEAVINQLKALESNNDTYVPPCTCGNRGYSALVNNDHFDGCPSAALESND